ncbi:spermidine synthase [Serinicoccus kebangsaanensis]|uniref:spermidine synthase n=1 Tax=Serinicoccus kebangsaanensis TaxID=2602069 RepID=UPI00124CC221|nr:fused MFS/spermidine synthase [Serinicoccus kebangsaanensis]
MSTDSSVRASERDLENDAGPASIWITVLFTATVFVGAGLLFVVQPMVARLVLPQFGGSATVWSTSSLFFQVLLLVGYAYVHGSTRWLGPRAQPVLHLGLLLLPLVALPVALPGAAAASGSNPVAALLLTLTLMIGLPFAVLSTTGPLTQKWYSWTGGRRADDPYFLFAASNLGSFGGLLAYPFLIEPFLSIDQQRVGWSIGYGLFLVLMLTCGAVTLVSSRARTRAAVEVRTGRDEASGTLRGREVLVWLALAFLPSTLMLGVTAHISTDVAAIPLLWVVPLAIYLGTFVIAFARTSRRVAPTWARAVTVAAVAAMVIWLMPTALPIWLVIGMDLLLLTLVAGTAHAHLAARRPGPSHLTAFYLVVALGGAVGGLVNGVLAPLLLPDVWEYPAAIAASTLLALPWARRRRGDRPRASRTLLVGLTVVLVLFVGAFAALSLQGWSLLALCLALLVLAWCVSNRPVAMVGGLLMVMLLPVLADSEPLVRDRSFYGAFTVRDQDGIRTFSHGTTVHGTQVLAEPAEPTTYYARGGPVGAVMGTSADDADIGVVGLGAGVMAAYGREGQRLTFYEIDPEVVDVASDPALFSYVEDSAAEIDMVVGDGRLSLEEVPAERHDVLFVDAFTSDAIPVHLLTREAFDTYGRALRDDGILMIHVSNRVFDLEPVVAAGAEHLGWASAVGRGTADDGPGATPSRWVALSADDAAIEELTASDRWRDTGAGRVRWTDDFASVLRVLDLGDDPAG